MKTTKRSIVLSSCLAIALCVCMITGGTFALFTSESKVNIAVTSGKVEVTANAQVTDLYSPKAIAMDGTITDATNAATETAFANGGTATIDGDRLTVANLTPGDKVSFNINVQNNGNVSTVYRYGYEVAAADGSTLEKAYALYGKLKFVFGTVATANVALYRTAWAELGETAELACSLELPTASTNDVADLGLSIVFTVEAAQGNLDTTDSAEVSASIVSSSSEMSALISGAEENETITVPATTNTNGKIFISNFTKNGVTLSGAGQEATVLATSSTQITANDVTISNATLYGYGAIGNTGHLSISGNNTTIENVKFIGNSYASGENITVSTNADNQGTTFRNMTIIGGFSGIRFWQLSGNSLIENCVINSKAYTFNVDAKTPGATLSVINTTLNGWTSYTSGIELVSFKGCRFGEGGGYACLRPYSTTTLENCEFTYDSFKLNAGGSGTYTITLTNCTKNGVAITAENVKDLLLDTIDWNANATLIVNGTTVTL